MMLAVLILAILGAGFAVIAAVVGFAAWCETISRNPGLHDDAAIGAAILEGVSWPVTAWRMLTEQEFEDE